MSLDQFVRLYLDWVNDFLTVEAFASYHDLSLEDAQFIIDTGRAINARDLKGSVNQ